MNDERDDVEPFETRHDVLVDRLFSQYDPFFGLGFRPECFSRKTGSRPPRPLLAELLGVDRETYRDVDGRDASYDVGRIAFFVDELRAGRTIDPIDVDNECHGTHIYPRAVVLDGHHRFAAAILLGCRTIPVEYGGRIDLLLWLTGETDEEPED